MCINRSKLLIILLSHNFLIKKGAGPKPSTLLTCLSRAAAIS